MFKPRKAHKLILMHGKHELDHQGTSSKRSGGGKVNGTKPYAGEGGMKKLLARRRKEAEEERKEKYEAMDEDEEVEEEKDSDQPRVDTVVGLDGSLKQEQTPKIVPVLPPAATSNSTVLKKQEHSSLRVGRTKTSRNHISRPVSRAKNRFSARCDEDDGDEADDVGSNDQTMLEEAAKNIPVFNIPSGFTFAQEVRALGIEE
jgi:nucleoporin NUP1